MFKYKLWEMLLYLGQMDWEAVGRARRDSRAGDFRNSRREDNRTLNQAQGLARKDITVANQRKPTICFMPSDLLENY